MYKESAAKLTEMGASITTREIMQQPELWQEAFDNYQKQETEIRQFLDQITAKFADQKVRVIFTGAGTSQYAGDTVVPYLSQHGDRSKFTFESIGTTSIVASPLEYLYPEVPTILVSFARSGNSPESVAAVQLAEQLIDNLYQITITCAPEGELAKKVAHDANSLLMLMPGRSNDKGFAMTGSFSCMSLSALLVFDTTSTAQKAQYVATIIKMGNEVVAREAEIAAVITGDFDRITYLGSGSLMGLTREAQLKILELTAGKVATIFDSSMGFRHGPKSFVNEKTLIFDFIGNDSYTRQYDVDIMEEIHGDQIAQRAIGIGVKKDNNFSGDNFFFETGDVNLPDGYLALADIMYAQTIALLTSVKVGNTPDTPSPSGTVNRVVKGVTIHPYQA